MTSPQDPQYPAPQQPYGTPPAPPQQPYGTPPEQQYGPPPQQPYGTAPQQQYGGAPQQQQYGAPLPPPPLATTPTVHVRPTPVAYLVPLAALLSVVGLATPWFRPHAVATAGGQKLTHDFDAFYSWRDGKIGLIAPILLVILAIGVIGLLRGKIPSRFSRGNAHPIESAGRAALVVGVVSLAAVAVAYALVTSQYKFTEDGKTYSWGDYIDFAKQNGVHLTLSRGPQIGLWLTAAGGVIALVAGVLLILEGRKQGRAQTA